MNEQSVEERIVMLESEIPEAIDYEIATEKGHCERLYDEEPNLNTMVFKNIDNSNSFYYFNYPVKYYDDNGVIRDKSSLLVDDKSSDSFISDSSDIKTSFSKNLKDGISLEFEDTQLMMLPMFVNLDKCKGELSEDSKNVLYDCGESISLDYTLTYQGFKENIILDKYNGISKFDFLLNTNGLELISNSDNELGLYDENEDLAATIGDIIVYDSNNNISFGYLSFEEINQSSKYIISINVDSEFLTSSDTIYPVYVDPTIEIDYEHTGIYGLDGTPGIVHATFYSDDTSFFGETMKVGKTSDSTIARSVMKFPGLIYLVNLFQMDRTLITGANVYIRDVGYQSDVNAIKVDCHKFEKRWFQPSDLKWSRDSTSYLPEVLSSNVICHSNGLSLTPLHTYSFDITSLVTTIWGSSGMNERCWDTGIMFKAEDAVESGNNVKYASFGSFNSVYYAPYLVIDYNDPQSEYRYSENANVSYTYKTSMYLTAGKTYKFRTGKATNYSGCDTELFLFKSDMEPGNNSWHNNDISSNNRYSEIEATISSSGNYILMAKCFTSPQSPVSYSAPTGHCNIYETKPDTNVEILKAEDAVLGGYILNLYNYNLIGNQDESITYSSFTANYSSTGVDPVMFIIGPMNTSENRVIGYNDDYRSLATGNYSWGNNARINQSYNANKKPIYIFVSSYSQNTTGTCEIYGTYKNSLPNINNPEITFPNLKLDDSIISASASNAYNCIAYSGGITSMWIDPQLTSQYGKYLSPWYNENNETALDNFYGNNPPRYNGATTYEVTINENESVVNVYKLGDEWTHASVRKPGNNNVHGYAWESKLGNGERIFHDIDSLSSDEFGNESIYGEVARMYKVSETNKSTILSEESLQKSLTIEKEVVLSDSQLDFLNQKLTEINYDIASQFYVLYDRWVDYIATNDNLKYSSNLSDYQKNIPYEELHKFISDNPEVFFLIARDYYNGHINIFTNIILVYEFVEKNEYSIKVANQIREANNAISINSLEEEVYIAPSYETNMKTFIKSMLNSGSYKLIQSE